ncbi:TPA: hypothetical protein N2786_003636 [Vibrio parahaemolyticus]|nr:hypothetical protein [Vibrio parahaemolyticus]
MIKYCDFSVEQMLQYIGKHSQELKLERVELGWRLWMVSGEHGEHENIGTLFNIVKQAFKPYLEQAKAERAEMRAELDKLIPAFRSVPEPLFSYMCRRCEQIVSSVDADGECDRCNGKEKRSNW